METRRLEQLAEAFARDVARSAAHETAQKMREIKSKLVAEARSLKSAGDATRWLAIVGFIFSLGVRRVLQQLHDSDRRARELLDECSFLLEDAVMTAYHVLLSITREDSSPSDALSSTSSSVSGVDASLQLSAFKRVLAFSGGSTSCLVVWTHAALALAIISLRTSRSPRAADLLDAVISQCQASDANERLAVWPLFLRGLTHAVDGRDDAAALRCVREGVTLAKRTSQQVPGVFHYWYAVVLSRNGLSTAAMDQLSQAVKNDFEPVASLNLQALLGLQAGDRHAAAGALERAVDIDFDEAASMFNYAVLLREMENYGAQFQMLEYYVEALEQTKDGDESRRVKTKTTSVGLTLFPRNETDQLLPCSRTQVSNGEVALEMAMAALESGAWQDSRTCFEEYFETLKEHPSLFGDEATTRSYIYVLLQCNRPTQALEKCNLALRESDKDLFIHFYKADALLCLERVDECELHLRCVIQPRLTVEQIDDEIKGLHVQLLNNLAIATVCRGNTDGAVEMLRDALRRYPDNLSVKFNLTMLLWRLGRQDAACTVWFEARGWSLQMDVGSVKDQQKALDFVARAEEEALCSVKQPKIVSHVTDSAEISGEIDESQLRYLDVLILNYWGNAQTSVVAKTAAQYVEYLESVVARIKKTTLV